MSKRPSKQSTVSFYKSPNQKRSGISKNREEIDDAKSHITGKSKAKSIRSKRQKSTATKDKECKTPATVKSRKSHQRTEMNTDEEGDDEDKHRKKAAADKISHMNANLDKSVNESFLNDSSFDASLSDDEESDDEDDFVSLQEFKDFKY